MKSKTELHVVNRRSFVLGSVAAAAFAAFAATGGGEAFGADSWEDAIKKVVGDATPAEGKVSVKLPEIAENGNTVPFTIEVDSPMSDTDYVKTVHVFATGNPRPNVGSFTFSPSSGVAKVSSRMRLGKTQDVVAVAELSNGKFYMAKQTVKVTIGGCGG